MACCPICFVWNWQLFSGRHMEIILFFSCTLSTLFCLDIYAPAIVDIHGCLYIFVFICGLDSGIVEHCGGWWDRHKLIRLLFSCTMSTLLSLDVYAPATVNICGCLYIFVFSVVWTLTLRVIVVVGGTVTIK